jgi:hypothetical protein
MMITSARSSKQSSPALARSGSRKRSGHSLGVAACRGGFSVRYWLTSHLLLALAHARQDGSLLSILRPLNKADVLILDDWIATPSLWLAPRIYWKSLMTVSTKSPP